MRWKIRVVGIRWDVGYADDYEHDPTYERRVAELPKEAEATVRADDEEEAVDKAMNEISDAYSFLIEDCKAVYVELLG